jgi:hypothetical protein
MTFGDGSNRTRVLDEPPILETPDEETDEETEATSYGRIQTRMIVSIAVAVIGVVGLLLVGQFHSSKKLPASISVSSEAVAVRPPFVTTTPLPPTSIPSAVVAEPTAPTPPPIAASATPTEETLDRAENSSPTPKAAESQSSGTTLTTTDEQLRKVIGEVLDQRLEQSYNINGSIALKRSSSSGSAATPSVEPATQTKPKQPAQQAPKSKERRFTKEEDDKCQCIRAPLYPR